MLLGDELAEEETRREEEEEEKKRGRSCTFVKI